MPPKIYVLLQLHKKLYCTIEETNNIFANLQQIKTLNKIFKTISRNKIPQICLKLHLYESGCLYLQKLENPGIKVWHHQ